MIKMGLLDEIQDGELEASSRLEVLIPGYDYRSQESFRETDEKLRQKFRDDLSRALTRLDDASDKLYREERTDEVERLSSLRDTVERQRRRIGTGQTGGGATRGLTQRSEADLLSLVEYDASLLEASEQVAEQSETLLEAVHESGAKAEFAECEQAIREFERTFDQRRDHLNGLM